MKPVLIVYGTTEGHTRKVAEFMARRIGDYGKDVDLIDSAAPEVSIPRLVRCR